MPSALRPKDAATLVLIRRDRDPPQVLLGQRHGKHAFMPNRYVFPGGTVDPTDSRVRPATPLSRHVAQRLERACSPARARALAVAAIRETYEETGLMLAKPSPGGPPLNGRKPWADFAARGLAPALDVLDYVARAVTPPGRPRRFNARFFMADAIAVSGEIQGSGELLDIRWFSFADALALPIPQITQLVIEEVARLLESPPAQDPARTVPLYRHRHGRDTYSRE
ncbi:MAG: NUDIX domain-containing protein [Alphaproteobacteria bacterium]|jgi:8-oxo-dGTP pyrophosphatase MutT (NUDIX family)|nr:NUDIX domain-containing protein [Alphaproteobacteria bacterium]MDP6518214.1 NUDIX domain-containing protein [Alphaproteobacteria bacterium]